MLPVTDRSLVRALLRVGAGAIPAAAVLLAMPPAALASTADDGESKGEPLSLLEALLWLAGIPLLIFVLVILLVSAPSIARGPRYRPGLGWWAAPVWFNGPDDADLAVRQATPTTDGGGASARW